MSEILLTQEVGSLAKPSWRVQPLAGQPVTAEHLDQAAEWAGRLDLDPAVSLAILETAQQEGGELSQETRYAIKQLAARYAIRLQEKAGLDILYDGEQDRPEMYQDAVSKTAGFSPRGRLRAFDNKSFLKSAVVEPPGFIASWYDAEFTRARQESERAIKVPITGAYTIADWSFDEFYRRRLDQGGQGLSSTAAKRAFVLDVAERVLRPNIASLLAAGAEWVQIDEPAATTKPDEVPLFVEAFNRSVAGLAGSFSVHICFSDYNLLFPYVSDLQNCNQFSLEFANRDGRDLGTDSVHRPAYEILQQFRQHTPDTGIGLGVTSVHDNVIEAPELVRDRVLRAVDIVDDPRLVYPSPDCGLRTRNWQVAFDKLRTTVEGTDLARQQLGA